MGSFGDAFTKVTIAKGEAIHRVLVFMARVVTGAAFLLAAAVVLLVALLYDGANWLFTATRHANRVASRW